MFSHRATTIVHQSNNISIIIVFISITRYSKVVLKGREGRGEKMNTGEEIGGRRGEKAGGKEIMMKKAGGKEIMTKMV